MTEAEFFSRVMWHHLSQGRTATTWGPLEKAPTYDKCNVFENINVAVFAFINITCLHAFLWSLPSNRATTSISSRS